MFNLGSVRHLGLDVMWIVRIPRLWSRKRTTCKI